MDPSQPPLLLGIEIGGTKLQITVGDCSGKIIDRVRNAIDAQAGAQKIREQIKDAIKKLVNSYPIKAIGVGFGGPVDSKSGTIELSHQIAGWGQFNLKSWLQDLTGLPVAIDNDANVAALAEAKHGGGTGYNTVFYMTVGSGIGGGLVIAEQIYHGRKPGEVEIGHLRLNKDGTTLEDLCSGWAVNKKVSEYIHSHRGSMLAALAQNSNAPAAYLLTPALEQQDPGAGGLLDAVADDLSFALSHVVHLFNPDAIIIGGGLSLLGGHLEKRLVQRLPNYLMKALLPAPDIKLAALGEDVVPIGAHEMAHTLISTRDEINFGNS